MCLIVKKYKKFKIAKKDIICYKIIVLDPINNMYYSPYVDSQITSDKEIIEFNQVAVGEEVIVNINNCNFISTGFIHTHKSLKYIHDLMYDIDRENPNNPNIKIFKCIIPKGIEYIEGVIDRFGRIEGFASKCIIYKEQILNHVFNY